MNKLLKIAGSINKVEASPTTETGTLITIYHGYKKRRKPRI